jgi:hypothetical protein
MMAREKEPATKYIPIPPFFGRVKKMKVHGTIPRSHPVSTFI